MQCAALGEPKFIFYNSNVNSDWLEYNTVLNNTNIYVCNKILLDCIIQLVIKKDKEISTIIIALTMLHMFCGVKRSAPRSLMMPQNTWNIMGLK